MNMKIKLDAGAKMPAYVDEASMALNLYSSSRQILRPCDWITIDTGVCVEFPLNCIGLLAADENLMLKHGITSRGIVEGNRNESIKVVLFNHSGTTYIVEEGDVIAQLTIIPSVRPELRLMNEA